MQHVYIDLMRIDKAEFEDMKQSRNDDIIDNDFRGSYNMSLKFYI